MRNLIFTSVALFLAAIQIFASAPREGMWIPFLLDDGNITEMQDMGLKISAEDIYSANQSSLKDAIVKFGGGCTGSVISAEGLLLTNHHCGYGTIQRHSSVENDLLKDGFWAMSKEEELKNGGLTVTFTDRMEDVTSRILGEGLNDVSIVERARIIQQKSQEVINEATEGNEFLEARVESFYGGNQYILIVTKGYKDIRLVGAPPSSIGKFGGDTDNWIWPRHTGDFSLFRIYANENNEPAEYSEDNVPYSPEKFLKVDDDGVEEGDFTMIFGFPARTTQYLTSHAVEYEINQSLPAKVALRTMRLDVINRYMRERDKVRIQYASKQSGISNAWKKWKGMIKGLRTTKALEKKERFEQSFTNETSRDNRRNYNGMIDEFGKIYDDYLPYDKARDYVIEAGLALELVDFAVNFRQLVAMSEMEEVPEEKIREETDKLIKRTGNFFKNYHKPIDREIFPKLLKAYNENVDERYRPDIFDLIEKKYDSDFEEYTSYVFDKSMLDDEKDLERFLKKYKAKDAKKIKRDPAFKLMSSILNGYLENVRPEWVKYNTRLDSLHRIYIQAQREIFPDREYYPDANFTLRLSYGKVQGFEPSDAVLYRYQTFLEGVMEKSYTMLEDYEIPAKLAELYEEKDYGPYGEGDKMPVCFLAGNHSSGGNSGSPVLNGNGELCGLNFDRNWEGTMSDIHYDPELCRNISVDMRYVLFIIDNFAGAGHLVDEMVLN